jgi:hypothetical protein
MKDELCRAFCDGITVREVPVGLAIGTRFEREGGDVVGFYVVYDKNDKTIAHIEDDGTTVPLLESSGADLSDEPRLEAFLHLMSEYGVQYDSSEAILHTSTMPVERIADASLGFVAFLLRMQDFCW